MKGMSQAISVHMLNMAITYNKSVLGRVRNLCMLVLCLRCEMVTSYYV